jgi:hypothetical protein
MASSVYMGNRRQYARPQGLLFSDNAGTLDGGSYVPTGVEGEDFIILSDHNRQPATISPQRIEDRKRMINGTMRSYHTADKLNISTSWTRLPSRAADETLVYDASGNILSTGYTQYTVDGGAGGVDLLSWWENHQGPFYVFLAYDKFRINGEENYNRLDLYNQVLRVYFSSFDYTIEKRGANNFDFWNISLALEEV